MYFRQNRLDLGPKLATNLIKHCENYVFWWQRGRPGPGQPVACTGPAKQRIISFCLRMQKKEAGEYLKSI